MLLGNFDYPYQSGFRIKESHYNNWRNKGFNIAIKD